MKIPFIKMHGIGNNYIFLDLFKDEYEEEIFKPLAIDISNVNTGIGSDGLILIHPSEVADVGMRIFNKDGSEGLNCGNGLRCVAKYVYEHELVDNETFKIETKSGVVTAMVFGTREKVDQITINMGQPKFKRSQIPMVGPDVDYVTSELFVVNGVELKVTAVFLGNPNVVFFVEDIEKAPLYELGGVISEDPRFPDRANVEFIEVLSKEELNFRVWERGSGVTQACGTGACASVVAAIQNGYVEQDEEILVHLSGGNLTIKWSADGNVWMTGPAEVTAEGVFYWNN